MKNKFLITLISGLVTIGIFGCSSSPSDKVVGTWKALPTESPCDINIFEVKNKDDNIILSVHNKESPNDFIEIGIAEQSKASPNTFTVPFRLGPISFTYFKSDDSLSFTTPPICPNIKYYRVK